MIRYISITHDTNKQLSFNTGNPHIAIMQGTVTGMVLVKGGGGGGGGGGVGATIIGKGT